jgi:hypothetical protein
MGPRVGGALVAPSTLLAGQRKGHAVGRSSLFRRRRPVLGESASATMGACWPGARCQGAVVRPGGGGRRVTRSWMDGLATTCPQPRGRGARPRGGGGAWSRSRPTVPRAVLLVLQGQLQREESWQRHDHRKGQGRLRNGDREAAWPRRRERSAPPCGGVAMVRTDGADPATEGARPVTREKKRPTRSRRGSEQGRKE